MGLAARGRISRHGKLAREIDEVIGYGLRSELGRGWWQPERPLVRLAAPTRSPERRWLVLLHPIVRDMIRTDEDGYAYEWEVPLHEWRLHVWALVVDRVRARLLDETGYEDLRTAEEAADAARAYAHGSERDYAAMLALFSFA